MTRGLQVNDLQVNQAGILSLLTILQVLSRDRASSITSLEECQGRAQGFRGARAAKTFCVLETTE